MKKPRGSNKPELSKKQSNKHRNSLKLNHRTHQHLPQTTVPLQSLVSPQFLLTVINIQPKRKNRMQMPLVRRMESKRHEKILRLRKIIELTQIVLVRIFPAITEKNLEISHLTIRAVHLLGGLLFRQPTVTLIISLIAVVNLRQTMKMVLVRLF